MFIAIGIGTNLGELRANLKHALDLLIIRNIVRDIIPSPIYSSKPLQLEDDRAMHPEYLNMAIIANTDLAPQRLLTALKEIEKDLGRTASKERWQARIIDLDILLYEHYRIRAPNLIIPHQEMLHRDFVLKPLSYLIADYYHPEGQRIHQYLRNPTLPQYLKS